MTGKKPKILEKKIITIAKKLKTFTANDIEVLTENSKFEIVELLEQLIAKNKLKESDGVYVYIPKNIRKNKENDDICNDDSLIHTLPFITKKPKEIYIKRINDLDGFVDYFFSPPKVKEKIKKIFKILKGSHGLRGSKLKEFLKKHDMGIKAFRRYKEEISKNGLVNLVGKETSEPGEIYYFFKDYYLSPKGLNMDEARELAIQRFERLIKMRLNRGKLTTALTMYKWMKKEYTLEQIEKYRNYNFSEFDTEKMFEENSRMKNKCNLT